MTTYWCVNFDVDLVLRHGLRSRSWLMQYQYSHGGYDFQGHRKQKGSTTRIWKRLREIQPGDWLVAYLKPNKLYAIGEVIEPRQRDRHFGIQHHQDSVDRTVRDHQHTFSDGIVRYRDAVALYEDFTDSWRCPPSITLPELKQPKTWLYPQRIDVRDWQYLVPEGVVVDGLKDVPVDQKIQAAFPIDESFFQRIKERLRESSGLPTNSDSAMLVRLSDEDADGEWTNEPPKYIPEDADERAVVARQLRERRGQQPFRNALRKRYGDVCLVTGCEVLAVLEAAHIKPYQGEKDNHSENGLLLRADIHTLFDLDLLGIEPDQLRVELHPSLARDEYYGHVAGKTLGCPRNQEPSRDALKLRYDRFQERLNQAE